MPFVVRRPGLTSLSTIISTAKLSYWLADEIYPTYACFFVKTIHKPTTRMQKRFASAQDAKRKDIKRAFGIFLQARFHILTTGCRLWSRDAMSSVIKTCVILHNLILDYERRHNVDGEYNHPPNYAHVHPFVVVARNDNQTMEEREGMMNHQMKSQERQPQSHSARCDGQDVGEVAILPMLQRKVMRRKKTTM